MLRLSCHDFTLHTLSGLLFLALFACATAHAAKPLDAATAKHKLQAKDVGAIVRIVSREKSVQGEIVSLNEQTVTIKESIGEITVPYADIVALQSRSSSDGHIARTLWIAIPFGLLLILLVAALHGGG